VLEGEDADDRDKDVLQHADGDWVESAHTRLEQPS
jgi:hypothetical protein